MSAAVRYDRVVVRLRYSAAAEVLGSDEQNVGVLVGLVSSHTRRTQVVTSVGIGRAIGHLQPSFLGAGQYLPPAAALLFDMESRWAFLPFVGLTANVFADVNRQQAFAGLGFGLVLGRL